MSPLNDLDNNGVPDWKEPWFWKAAGTWVASAVKMFAPSHTLAWRVSDAFLAALDNGGSLPEGHPLALPPASPRGGGFSKGEP